MNNINKQNNILKIIVNLINSGNHESKFFKFKDIICPEYYEPCRIKMKKGKFYLIGCSNNHKINNIRIVDLPDTQRINMSNIVCNECRIKNMENSHGNQIYRCLTSSKNICILCKSRHDTNHKSFIKYEQKNYICPKHGGPFIKPCNKCKLNLCINCGQEHKDHKTIYFEELSKEKEEISNYLSYLKKVVEKFNDDINDIIEMIEKLKDLSKSIDIYYQIYTDFLNNYDLLNTNYFSIKNIRGIINDYSLITKIDEISEIKAIKDKFDNMLDIYYQFNYNRNKMTIIYNIDKNTDKIKLFGEDEGISFVENNKDKCYLLIGNDKHDLIDEIKLNEEQKTKNTLEIKLIETKPISNMSNMFFRSISLMSLPDISKWDTKNVADMRNMFGFCKSLISLLGYKKS